MAKLFIITTDTGTGGTVSFNANGEMTQEWMKAHYLKELYSDQGITFEDSGDKINTENWSENGNHASYTIQTKMYYFGEIFVNYLIYNMGEGEWAEDELGVIVEKI